MTTLTKQSQISLREITKDTVWKILRLKPSHDQKRFIASNAESIAEAYFQQDYAWFRAIYADEFPVGFIMLGMDPKEDFCFLWRFMIDRKHQKKGFGKRALTLALEHIKSTTSFLSIITSYPNESGNPGEFYKKMGFIEGQEKIKQSILGKEIKQSNQMLLQLSFS